MRIVSVNSAKPATLPFRGNPVETGIFKRPVAGTAKVGRLGIEGDTIADLRVHGGPDQALNVYPAEHYAFWEAELGTKMPGWGAFGENLTTEGLFESEVCIGDIFRAGTIRVQASKPRPPCYKLETAMGIEGFQDRVSQAGLTGFYLRILQEGEVRAGDAIVLERRDPAGFTMRAAFALMMGEPVDSAVLRRGLAAEGLSEGLRQRILRLTGAPDKL